MKMKVTIILPTYSRPGFLAQAVHTVLQQAHPIFEIFIVGEESSSKHRTPIAGKFYNKWLHSHVNKARRVIITRGICGNGR